MASTILGPCVVTLAIWDVARDEPVVADPDPEAPSNHRYVYGQRLYLQVADPRSHADWVFENTDLARPHLQTRGRPTKN